MKKSISIIIVTYNSDHLIFDCLDSIFKHNDIGNELELIVIDNCSIERDRMFSKIRADYPDDIILIKSPQNNGYGHGNNQGVQIASSNRIVIMNPDVRLTESIFYKLIAHFEANQNVGMMGVCFKDGSNPLYLKPEHSNLFKMFFTGLYLKLGWYNINHMFFSGSFLIFDKQSFIKAGCFDENIFLFHEEADISNRILAIGKETMLAKDISVLHLAHGREVDPYLLKEGAESRKYYFTKYHANLDKHYRNNLIIYRLKYLFAIIFNNKTKAIEFRAWINMCKFKGNI